MESEFKPYWAVVSIGDKPIYLRDAHIKHINTIEDEVFFTCVGLLIGKFRTRDAAWEKYKDLQEYRLNYEEQMFLKIFNLNNIEE